MQTQFSQHQPPQSPPSWHKSDQIYYTNHPENQIRMPKKNPQTQISKSEPQPPTKTNMGKCVKYFTLKQIER